MEAQGIGREREWEGRRQGECATDISRLECKSKEEVEFAVWRGCVGKSP